MAAMHGRNRHYRHGPVCATACAVRRTRRITAHCRSVFGKHKIAVLKARSTSEKGGTANAQAVGVPERDEIGRIDEWTRDNLPAVAAQLLPLVIRRGNAGHCANPRGLRCAVYTDATTLVVQPQISIPSSSST